METFRLSNGVEMPLLGYGVFNADYAQYFTGNSYLADVGGGLLNVTFELGCRNNWHIHHKAVTH